MKYEPNNNWLGIKTSFPKDFSAQDTSCDMRSSHKFQCYKLKLEFHLADRVKKT